MGISSSSKPVFRSHMEIAMMKITLWMNSCTRKGLPLKEQMPGWIVSELF
jgi:hypothetical protein